LITIIADEGKNRIGNELYDALISQGVQAEYVSLENVEVKPCVNCGGCTYKTYGRCVVRDDGDWIYPKVLLSDVLIIVTPVVFESYSFKLKRVLDKFGLFMDRHYFVVNGEMTKGGMPDRTFKCFAVGVSESDAEGEAFKKLFHELLTITRGAGKAYVTGAALSVEIKSDILKEVARA
jgi:multimeric flavodoxin WrbA